MRVKIAKLMRDQDGTCMSRTARPRTALWHHDQRPANQDGPSTNGNPQAERLGIGGYCSFLTTTKASHINGLSNCGPRPYLHAGSRLNMHVPYCFRHQRLIELRASPLSPCRIKMEHACPVLLSHLRWCVPFAAPLLPLLASSALGMRNETPPHWE